MKLCIDARMVSCSGIGTVLKHLIPPLSSPPFSASMIVCSNVRKEEKSIADGSWIQCDAPIYSIQEQISLPRLIPECDIFWSPHYNVPLWPIRAKKRIATIHDAYHLAFKDSMGWKKKLYAEIMFRQAVFRSDGIITDSKFSQDELCRLLPLPKEKIQVIYPAVDFDRFSEKIPQEAKENIKKKYSLPSSFFLFVGNLKPHKNLRLILDAYEQSDIDIPLVVIGKKNGLLQLDPALQRIENSPKLNNRVFAIGEAPDEELPAFYQMAVSLVFPSLYEGFGLPPLEAMAASCPAIVSSRASIPEVCGSAACFIDGSNPEELAASMIQVAQDAALRSSLIEKGQIQARKFSWETTASQYRKVFEEIHFS